MTIEHSPVALRIRLRGGITLRVWETEHGSIALWCTRSGSCIRVQYPPIC